MPKSYVWLPEGSPLGHHDSTPQQNRGKATFLFRCSESVVVTFKVEGSAPNTGSDSFYMAVDDGAKETWHYPTTDDWHWQTFSSEYSISEGRHELHVMGREDGTKLRRVGIVKGKDACCFAIAGIFQL